MLAIRPLFRAAPLAALTALLVPHSRAQNAHDVGVLRAAAWRSIEARAEQLVDLSDAVWRHAETSLQEERSSAVLADYLEKSGFSVERGVADMPTAFVATYGEGRPIVGILAEFDALPGISNVAEPRRAPRVDGAPGHGCGHNLFGAASTGAAVAAKEVMEAQGLGGTIVLFGCPAEETVVGKVYMAKAGVFDDLDVCLDWHPGQWTGVDFSKTRAMNNFTVEFFGETAHGAGDPWNGRSALDAVELMNHAVNMLREHIEPTNRIHYVVADGGGAPNVVPAYAKVWYYVRDFTRDGVEDTYRRVLKCAEGAAIATETTHEVHLVTGVHSYLLNRPLSELLDRNLRAVGPPEWSAEEQGFAKAIQQATGKPEEGMFVGLKDLPEHEEDPKGGSTDVAEVSRIAPTAKLRVASSPIDTPWHAWPVVACSGTSIGHKAMLVAGKTLGGAAVELLVSPDLIAAARKEFETKTDGAPYQSPIPAGQLPPTSGNR